MVRTMSERPTIRFLEDLAIFGRFETWDELYTAADLLKDCNKGGGEGEGESECE